MKKAIVRLLVCFIPVRRVRRAVRHKLVNYRPRVQKRYKNIKAQWQTKMGGKKLLPGRFDEYDLVFAIGGACPMTQELVMHKLRTFSNPFDWTDSVAPTNWFTDADVWRDTRFLVKIRAICNDFVDFFNQEDIKAVSADVEGVLSHHIVCNMRTQIRFMHLFPVNKSIESTWDEISLKTIQRGNRLIKEINSSQRVLICWGHRIMYHKERLDAPVSDSDIKTAVGLLCKRFPHTNIDLVFFEHDGTKQDFEYDKITVCDGAYRIKSNHYIETNEYAAVLEPARSGDTEQESLVVAEALDNIKLSKWL